jgi:hypothetical protein
MFDSLIPCRALAMPRPCRSESDFSSPRLSGAWVRQSAALALHCVYEFGSAVHRLHVCCDLLAFGFFRLPRGFPRSLLSPFPRILWNSNVRCRVHNSALTLSIPSDINSVHATRPHAISWRSTLIVSSHLCRNHASDLFRSASPSKNHWRIVLLPKTPYMPWVSPLLLWPPYATDWLIKHVSFFYGVFIKRRQIPVIVSSEA